MSLNTSTNGYRRISVVGLIGFFFASCATPPGPATTNEAVERLFAARQNFEGASSLANVRVTGKGGQSFRAALTIDAGGAMNLSALTPFGTTAAQVRIEDDRITLINHLRNTWWDGRLDQLSGGHALAEAFRVEGLSYLLTGLPPWSDQDRVSQEIVSEEFTRLSQGPLSLILSRSGIMTGLLDLGDDEIAIRFEGQSIPPAKLQVSSSIDPTRVVQFEHINLEFKSVTLNPLRIPADYRRAQHWETVVQ